MTPFFGKPHLQLGLAIHHAKSNRVSMSQLEGAAESRSRDDESKVVRRQVLWLDS